ncbi:MULTISPECIES: hypothetical protein [Pectobacterium]|uniref:hypothetical protein n=1 Tax=Pectobacterium TaxID=122277 RepID=UPI0015DECDBD|nr:hypothetical protein [Pectobacterium sp. CFBP8739]MBA0166811.1 hypothetical protein [Pectobacterium sp. CFBP8739]
MNINNSLTPIHTLPLILIQNSGGRSSQTQERKKIDISEFPDGVGAYVIRYLDYSIPRFIKASPILKIGCTTDSFKGRFKNYNHQSDMTLPDVNLYEQLKIRSQKTNVRIMHFLAHNKHQDEIVIDFYLSTPDNEKSPKTLEHELIRNYLEIHGELPPLNFGMK